MAVVHDDSGSELVRHYSPGGLRQRIEAGLAELDEPVSVELLGAVDEFHVGGRAATRHLAAQLELAGDEHVLDLGSGLGGTARLLAADYGVRVTGVDITPEYVDVAHWLTGLVGLLPRCAFSLQSATDLRLDDAGFDAATMVHVGMNIADLDRLVAGVARVVRPGSRFGIYDLMATGLGGSPGLTFPLPWASEERFSHVRPLDEYEAALVAFGFDVVASDDRTAAAIETFESAARAIADAGGPPPVGLHLVMGSDAPTKFANLAAAIRGGIVAPTELIAVRR